VLDKVVIPMVASPSVGFLVAFLVMVALFWLVRHMPAAPVNGWFRRLQPLSAAFMAFSHGTNDAQKTMGVITLALVAAGKISTFQVPLWVIGASALAMAAGTLTGGWRIIHTLGARVIKLDPIHGFAAETSAATVIQVATHFGLPISTTHTITASIMGTGATQRLSAVRWGVAGNIVTAWILTLPAAGAVAAIAYTILHLAS
jgi:PiT family inorganic phosphate transporter